MLKVMGFVIGLVLLLCIAAYFVMGERAPLRIRGGLNQAGGEVEKGLPTSNDAAAGQVGVQKSKEELAEEAVTLIQGQRLVNELKKKVSETKGQISDDKFALGKASKWLKTGQDHMVDANGRKHSRAAIIMDAEHKLSRLRDNKGLLPQLQDSLDQLTQGLQRRRSSIDRKKLEIIKHQLTLVQLDIRDKNAEFIRQTNMAYNRYATGPSKSSLEATARIIQGYENKVAAKEELNKINQSLVPGEGDTDVVSYKKTKSSGDLSTRIKEALTEE